MVLNLCYKIKLAMQIYFLNSQFPFKLLLNFSENTDDPGPYYVCGILRNKSPCCQSFRIQAFDNHCHLLPSAFSVSPLFAPVPQSRRVHLSNTQVLQNVSYDSDIQKMWDNSLTKKTTLLKEGDRCMD